MTETTTYVFFVCVCINAKHDTIYLSRKTGEVAAPILRPISILITRISLQNHAIKPINRLTRKDMNNELQEKPWHPFGPVF
jgi:hypothetical protein